MVQEVLPRIGPPPHIPAAVGDEQVQRPVREQNMQNIMGNTVAPQRAGAIAPPRVGGRG
jgi:hypothetical protein